ncbi:MAG TPA: hypothetical protein VN812_13020 [Candidatus Acidoferrales bacterium]|nr:hypothetical protein [Candidatus Acidoferrales bacterium]
MRTLTEFALAAAVVLMIYACNKAADQPADGSSGGGFRLSLSKREVPLDGTLNP